MPYIDSFCACARAVNALARLNACLGLSKHCLIGYAISCVVYRFESSECSGETASMLRLV